MLMEKLLGEGKAGLCVGVPDTKIYVYNTDGKNVFVVVPSLSRFINLNY